MGDIDVSLKTLACAVENESVLLRFHLFLETHGAMPLCISFFSHTSFFHFVIVRSLCDPHFPFSETQQDNNVPYYPAHLFVVTRCGASPLPDS